MEERNVDLNFVQKQFLCCTPLNKFLWNNYPDHKTRFNELSPKVQKQILDSTINHELVKSYPIKRSYQKAFLKLLIDKLETNCQEVHDDVYSTYCSLVSSDDLHNSTQYRHFLYNKNSTTTDIITLQESVNIVSLGTTGLCTWQAGLRLAEWCLANTELFTGKKILELGCGVGLTGLTVIRTCKPKEYVFSDSHPAVLAMLSKNITINCSSQRENVLNNILSNDIINLQLDYNGVNVRAICLPWEEINDDSNGTDHIPNPEVVLAADVLYDNSCFKNLITALCYLLRNNCNYAVIAATVRNADTISEFTQILGSYDLVFQELKLPEQKCFIQVDNTPVQIMKITRLKT